MGTGRKSQMWSLDSIIATVIFVSAISAFIVLISANLSTEKHLTLKDESKAMPQILLGEDQELSVVKENKVNLNSLKKMQDNYEYEDLKSLLGVKSDFCIYFEDDAGNLIDISRYTNSSSNSVGIGNSDVVLTANNIHCMS